MKSGFLIQSLENDRFIFELLHLNMKSISKLLKKEFMDVIVYLEKKMKELEYENWKYQDFLIFKKYYLNLTYFNSFTVLWENIFTYHTDLDFIQNLEEKMTDMIYRVRLNECFMSEFKNLQEKEKCSKKKELYAKWYEWLFVKDNQGIKSQQKYFQLEKQIEQQINLLKENNEKSLFDQKSTFFIPFNKKENIKGLPKDVDKLGKDNAINMGKNGWLFYLYDDVSINLLLTFLENRNVRKNIYEKYKKLNSNLYSNMNHHQILSQVLNKKQKLAQVLNKENYLELVLSDFILNSPKKVFNYLSKIELEISDIVEKTKQDIKEYAAKDFVNEIKPWDMLYYASKLMKEHQFIHKKDFQYYFEHKLTIQKMLLFFEKQFQIKFQLLKEENKVLYYKVIDSKCKKESYFIIHLYGNCYQEMNICSYEEINKNIIPNIQYIELNLNNIYLSFDEIKFILHEFGHAFHDFFATEYKLGSLNELNQSWDLIELPSKFLELFAYNKDFIKMISSHIKTKKKIDDETIFKIYQQEEHFKGYELHKEIQKYKAKLFLYQNFKPNSKKNPYELIIKGIENEGIIYNILRDNHLSDYKNDYSPIEYIYLFCEQMAYSIYESFMHCNGMETKDSMRNIYIKIFNAKEKYNKVLPKFIDMKATNTIKMLQKNINIELYGMNTSSNKQRNLIKTILG